MLLSKANAETLQQTLQKNADIFTWVASGMPGVSPDVITHKLFVYKEA